MGSSRNLLSMVPAWSAAVLVTTVIASLLHSWSVQSGLEALGARIPADVAVKTAAADLRGMAVPLLLVFGLALAIGFAVAGWLRPRLPQLAAIGWPLAGAGAIGMALLLMRYEMQITPLAGARGAMGYVLFCGAGAIGGLVFAWVRPR